MNHCICRFEAFGYPITKQHQTVQTELVHTFTLENGYMIMNRYLQAIDQEIKKG